MTRVVLRNAYWITIAFTLLSLLSLLSTGCSSVPQKLAPVNLPSTLPTRQAVSATKVSTAATKASTASAKKAAEDARDALDQSIVEAHQASVKAGEDCQKQIAPILVSLDAAKKLADDSAAKSELADARAEEADAKANTANQVVEVLKTQQESVALKVMAVEQQNEELINKAKAGQRFWGLGNVWIGLKDFFAHALLWLAGFAVVLGALSFFVPAIGAFVTMVLTNLFKLFTKR